MSKKAGLGRGIGALIPMGPAPAVDTTTEERAGSADETSSHDAGEAIEIPDDAQRELMSSLAISFRAGRRARRSAARSR